LIVQTRPEIALYVLNHKRAHLRTLEERFRVSITVNADTEIGGQVGFAIDRGEQVMTIEQARALAAQVETAPLPQAAADDEAATTDVADAALEAAETADEGDLTQLGETASHEDTLRETDREPGRGRRRRRRRGRGRGADVQEPAAPDLQWQHGHDGDHPDMAAVPDADSTEAAASGSMPFEGAEPRAALGEANGNGEAERRRRRRGRRGGRRNRRDREGQPLGEFAVAHETDLDRGQRSAPDADTDLSQHSDWSTSPDQPQQLAAFAHGAEIHEHPFEQMENRPAATELMAAPAPAEPQVAPAPEDQPPRRRSTVREPAPEFATGSPAVPPSSPRPEPLPAPVVSSSADTDEASRPRRTGWWARRLLGGEKGQG
jgi:ribonuclease E